MQISLEATLSRILRILAQQHLGCKFLHINSDKAPFFVGKLGIQVLPTVVVFRDGKVTDLLMGFEDLGGKDDFRTPVLEHWLALQGCIKLKKHSANRDCDSDGGADSDCSDDD